MHIVNVFQATIQRPPRAAIPRRAVRGSALVDRLSPSVPAVPARSRDGIGRSGKGRARTTGRQPVGPRSPRPPAARSGGRALHGAALRARCAGAGPVLEARLVDQSVGLLADPAFNSRFGIVPSIQHDVVAPDPAWDTAFQIRLLGPVGEGLGLPVRGAVRAPRLTVAAGGATGGRTTPGAGTAGASRTPDGRPRSPPVVRSADGRASPPSRRVRTRPAAGASRDT